MTSTRDPKAPTYSDIISAKPYLISPGDTVKLAVIHYPESRYDVSVIFEVWDVGGSQPPNMHEKSVETFFFLSGEGIAYCDDYTTRINAGGFLMLPAQTTHRIQNTGASRLYAITTMSPDAGFADLIISGTPSNFDPEDLIVISGYH